MFSGLVFRGLEFRASSQGRLGLLVCYGSRSVLAQRSFLLLGGGSEQPSALDL